MLREMTSRQMAEWMAYYNIEPWGAEFLDAHFAQLNTTTVNKDRKRSQQVDAKRFRLLKDETQTWDPQAWFDGLKRAVKWTKRE